MRKLMACEIMILFRLIFSWLLNLLILFALISRCITLFSSFIVSPLVPSNGALEKRSVQSIHSMSFMILYTSIRSPRFLLVFMVVKFRFFSLISYGNLFSSGMHFVNRCRTPSNSLISLILFEHQDCTQ